MRNGCCMVHPAQRCIEMFLVSRAMAAAWCISSNVSSVNNLKLVCSTAKRRDEMYRCHEPVCTLPASTCIRPAVHHLSLRRLGPDCSNCRSSPRPTLCVSHKQRQPTQFCHCSINGASRRVSKYLGLIYSDN